MTAIQRLPIPALSAAICFTALSPSLLAQQEARTPQPAPPATTRPAPTAQTAPRETPMAMAPQSRSAVPQGFSVVLVQGDIQAVASSDDIPPVVRKALTDMRDFLPYKSFRLLDAAWVLCCGHDVRRGSGETTAQALRGPEGQEYFLQLTTSRAQNNQVFVRFSLEGAREIEVAAASDGASMARRLADAQDRVAMIQVQLQEARTKVEVGTAPKSEVTKLEYELRAEQRRVEDLRSRAARESTGAAQSSGTARARSGGRQTILDTTFTMDVGETVVVGTSRLKGGSKALIALLTAVPPRTSTTAKE